MINYKSKPKKLKMIKIKIDLQGVQIYEEGLGN